MIGVSCECYVNLETGEADYYPKRLVDKLAALYKIPAEDLLDDYSLFLYDGQGRQIREHRQSLGPGKRPYARLMKMNPNCLLAWESEKKCISRSTWEKYFKGVIKA